MSPNDTVQTVQKDRGTVLAEERGHQLLELAVAWLAAQDGVCSVITGATSPGQVHANAAAAAWTLSAEDLSAIAAII